MSRTTSNGRDLVNIAVDITAAYVRKAVVPMKDLPDLVRSVHAALAELVKPEPNEIVAQTDAPLSAAKIRKSITRDGLLSFIDGKSYKTLKHHLGTHGLDPQSYRQRYGLPADYPMMAASYAEQRSDMAKAIWLGRKSA